MDSDLRLEAVDRDGALADALGSLHGHTRVDLLRGALVSGGALLAACAAPASASAALGRARDASILNFALTLEELQAAFYTEVERNRVLRGRARAPSRHRRRTRARPRAGAFRDVLGSKAIKRPHFDFGGATEGSDAFRRTAVAFEDLAVAAYKGQAPHIRSRAYLASALAIHSVEARHAAWIRRLAGKPPVAGPFDEPRLARGGDADRRADALRGASGRVAKGPRFTG